MDIRTRLGLLLAFAALVGATPAAAQAPAGVTPAAIAQGRQHLPRQGHWLRLPRRQRAGCGRPEPDRLPSGSTATAPTTPSSSRSPPACRRKSRRAASRCRPRADRSITDDEVKAVAAYVYSLSHKSRVRRVTPAARRGGAPSVRPAAFLATFQP